MSRSGEGFGARRRLLVLGVLGVIVAAAGVGAYLTVGQRESARQERVREEVEMLKNATAPGRAQGIEAGREIVGGPAAEDNDNRAYPAAVVAFPQEQRTWQDSRRLDGKRGGRFARGWEAIGPDTLNVDTLGTQTYGVDTQWSGRVTAVGVGKPCNQNDCRVTSPPPAAASGCRGTRSHSIPTGRTSPMVRSPRTRSARSWSTRPIRASGRSTSARASRTARATARPGSASTSRPTAAGTGRSFRRSVVVVERPSDRRDRRRPDRTAGTC